MPRRASDSFPARVATTCSSTTPTSRAMVTSRCRKASRSSSTSRPAARAKKRRTSGRSDRWRTSLENDDLGADLGEVPHEVGIKVGLALATAGQPGSQLRVLLVARPVGDMTGNPVEADVADVRLQPADHVRKERFTVPRCRHLAAAVDLVGAGDLVVVLAARHQPRADDAIVLVDGPYALSGSVVDDTLSATRIGRQWWRIGTTGGHERERVPEQIDGTGSGRWRMHDQ